MSKNITKTIAATLAATLGAGVVPAMAATTTLADLHKASYDAVLVAQKDKTQKSINDARTLLAEYKVAIEKENKLGLLPQVNTFSAQLDGVQQPILSKIIKAIVAIETKKTATQAEINEIRTMVEGSQATTSDDVKLVWARTYNAKVDPFQATLIANAKAAVAKAETEKTKEAVDAAKVLVAELNTSVRAGVKAIAATELVKADAVVVVELKINSVNVLKDSVELEFNALNNTLADVTIDVVDNNGKVVEVQPVVKMIEGKSKQKFDFKKIYATTNEKIEGVWTINGVKVDMTEKKLVNKVVTAKDADGTASNRNEAMILLQNKAYISGLAGKYTTEGSDVGIFVFATLLDEDGAPTLSSTLYANEIAKVNGETPIKTAKDIQAVVTSVNKAAGIVADEKEIVDIIKASAGKPVQFTNALNAQGMERVNESFVATTNFETVALSDSYNNAALQAANTLKDIQKVIDAVNIANVAQMKTILSHVDTSLAGTSLVGGTLYLNLDKVTNLLDTAKEYINPTEKTNKDDKKTILETTVAELSEQIALINVVNCDNTGALKSALTKLSDASEELDFAKQVYEKNMLTYLKKVVDTDGKVKLTALEVKNTKALVAAVITTTNTANMEDSITAIKTEFATAVNYLGVELTEAAKVKISNAFDSLVANSALEVNTVDATTGKVTVVNKFDKAILVDANLAKYKVAIAGSLKNVDALTAAIVTANNTLAGTTVTAKLEAINVKAANGKELYAALSSEILSGKIKGLVPANAAQYEADFAKFAKVGTPTDADYIKDINKSIEIVNARTEMLTATTTTAMLSGLNKYVVLVPSASTIIDIQTDIAEELVLLKTGAYGDVTSTFKLVTVADTDAAIITASNKRTTKLDALNNAIVLTPAVVAKAQVGTAQVGTAQVGTAQVGTAQVGTAQVGTAQVGTAQVGTPQVGNLGDVNYAAASSDYAAASSDYAAASSDYAAASSNYAAASSNYAAASSNYVAASNDYAAASSDYAAEIKASAAEVKATSLALATSLNKIDGTYSVAQLAAKAQIFVANATTKDDKGVVTGKVTYTSYAQIRAAIQRVMN